MSVSASTFEIVPAASALTRWQPRCITELMGGMVIELLSASIGEVVVTHPPLPPRG